MAGAKRLIVDTLSVLVPLEAKPQTTPPQKFGFSPGSAPYTRGYRFNSISTMREYDYESMRVKETFEYPFTLILPLPRLHQVNLKASFLNEAFLIPQMAFLFRSP